MKHAIPSTSLLACLSLLNDNKGFGVPIVNEQHQMIAFLFDGDIRRALISGTPLTDECINSANTNFYFVYDESEIDPKLLLSLRSIPVLNHDNTISHFVFTANHNSAPVDSIAGFIAAGGRGTRLMPLTQNTPKPLVKLNGIPLIERIIQKFVLFGLKTIYVSVNYMAEQIIDRIGDGRRWDIEIIYLKEDFPLGTAGSLSLISDVRHDSYLLTNGDIYSEINWSNFHDFHLNNGFNLTIASVPHRVTVPFGVIESSLSKLVSLSEKPTFTYDCNAGIYSINANVLPLVPSNMFFNMTDLIDKVSSLSQPVGVYKLHEYWADIGNLTQYEENQKMLELLSEHFE